MRLRRAGLLRALCALALATPTLAQELPQAPDASDLARAQDILRARNRETMHPDDPLALVGLEQGDNDLRSRTPALARSTRVATLIDRDDDYARKLAMVEDGVMFHEPPRGVHPLASPERPVERVPLRDTARSAVPAEKAVAPSRGGWLLAFALVLAGVLWWIQKRLHLALWRTP